MRAWFISAVLFMLLSGPVYAESSIALTFKDANNNQLVKNAPLLITAVSPSSDVLRIARFIDGSGKAEVPLDAGRWAVKFRVDKPNTPGFDYFSEQELTVDENNSETIFLVPGGTLRGTVVDQLENVVGNAELKFDCPAANQVFPSSTDNFGMFAVEWIPAGTCSISAKYRSGVGSQTITIIQGEVANMEIKLDKKVVEPVDRTWMFIAALLAIAAGAAVWFYKRKHHETNFKPVPVRKVKKEAKKTAVKETGKGEPNKRAHDIIQTLSGKEKQVVDYLMANPEASQAKIYYQTGIPKTSLARILQSLTHKKVIEIERIGKFKKVKLTGWFLGKE